MSLQHQLKLIERVHTIAGNLLVRHLNASSLLLNKKSVALPRTNSSDLLLNKKPTITRKTCCFASQNTISRPDIFNTAYEYDENHYWDYSLEYGPENWERWWETKARQSPIDIVTKDVQYDSTLKPFAFDNTPVKLSYLNNGVNALVTPRGRKKILLTGGPLEDDIYEFMQFHFHWGEVDYCGCEHTIDGHRYAAELHIVHYNRTLYKDKNDAFTGAGGLAVLGIFLDAKEDHEDNSNLDAIVKAFNNIQYEGDKFRESATYSVYNLLPRNTGHYFTYDGSLTTPPLTENVKWTVFNEPIKISKRLLRHFSKLYAVRQEDEDKECMRDPFIRSSNCIPQPPHICNNHRPVQPLHGRVVRSSFQP